MLLWGWNHFLFFFVLFERSRNSIFENRANVLGRMKNPSKSTIERKKYNARGTTYETTHATTNLFSRVMLAELQLAYCCKNVCHNALEFGESISQGFKSLFRSIIYGVNGGF